MKRLLLALLLTGCVPITPNTLPAAGATTQPAPQPTPRPPHHRLYLSSSAPLDATFLMAVVDAALGWNEAVGFEVFSWDSGEPIRLSQFIAIKLLPPDPDGYVIGGRQWSGNIAVSSETQPHRRYVVAAHELGHALGLTHSTNPADIMHFSGAEREFITPADAARALAITKEQ